MPLEGGLYQWAKLRWGEMTGFLVAWNLWWYAVRRAGLALGKWFPNTGSIIVIILFGSNVAIRDPGLDGRQDRHVAFRIFGPGRVSSEFESSGEDGVRSFQRLRSYRCVFR
jgi:hypothetical protein